MSISFDWKVRVPDDVLVSQLDGESVLLKLKSECYFGLDEIGTRIWDLLRSSDSIQGAYETLVTEYDEDPDKLRADLTELLGSFVEQGLIEVASA
jgi:coenzyme PQQ synthesis protein D (PqqD)